MNPVAMKQKNFTTLVKYSTVLSESRCALRLQYVDLVVSIEAHLMSVKLE
jgi:hypothetical protein